uniref:Reverse transcriptase domain-containing protein n=1 Tax=Xenopus tropicalis TaxID=8364 RepID=A0A803K169_XENTR
MYQAAIVLLPKAVKDPTLPESYRPISLLTANVKILAKLLANRLKKIIGSIIADDQLGFMPGKTTAMNVRRLFLNLTIAHANSGERAIAALDIAKAFDTVEWPYLWKALDKFGFGTKFVNLVKLLYKSPTAFLRVGTDEAPPFNLTRGTRQGCPLSPLLFAIAIEPFVAAVRQHPNIVGWVSQTRTDKLQLYADDTLIYLGDRGQSLNALIELTEAFGTVSGLKVSQAKSLLFPVDPQQRGPRSVPSPLPIANQFTYLGVDVPITTYYDLNLGPMLGWMGTKFAAWGNLPIGPAGRIQLIKMFVQPKIMYALWHMPTAPPKTFFSKLDTAMRSFIWGKGRSRLSLPHLKRSKTGGGMALPDFRVLYLAVQLSHLSPLTPEGPCSALYSSWQELLPPYIAPWQAALVQPSIPPHNLLVAAVRRAYVDARKTAGACTIDPATPLWGNKVLGNLAGSPPPRQWLEAGLTSIQDVWDMGVTAPFAFLRQHRSLPASQWLLYHRVHTTLKRLHKRSLLATLEDPLLSLIRSGHKKCKISTLYKYIMDARQKLTTMKCRESWEKDLGPILDDQWKEVLASPITVSINCRHEMLQLYLIHRAYYTPAKLHKIYQESSPLCFRCQAETGTLLHTLWSCPMLTTYWASILNKLNAVIDSDITPSPKVCILGITSSLELNQDLKTLITKALFQARRQLTLNWKGQTAPSYDSWLSAMNEVCLQEKHSLCRKGKNVTYTNIWGSWEAHTARQS